MQPHPKSNPPTLRVLASPEDLAVARFGQIEGLAIVRKTTLDLAQHYASKYSLEMEDPDVCIIASALAFTRHKQMILLTELEQDIYMRTLASPDGDDYGRTLFRLTRSGAHKEVHREVDRLHSRARAYSKELRQLGQDAAKD
jgi:hypothetical protein